LRLIQKEGYFILGSMTTLKNPCNVIYQENKFWEKIGTLLAKKIKGEQAKVRAFGRVS